MSVAFLIAQVERREPWSLDYARRCYDEGPLTVEQYEDLVAWVLDGGDLRLITTRRPWPWRTR